MSCSMSNLNLLTKKQLTKFIQKIGHYQAARIIEEHKIDGSRILSLTRTDISKWHLTAVEEELLWKCINQLRLNHVTEINYQENCIQQKQLPNEQKHRQSINKYFKFKPNKKHSNDLIETEETEMILSKSFSNVTLESEMKMFDDSENFIQGSYFKRNNDALVDQLKKCLAFNSHKNNKYELLTNTRSGYISLTNLNDTNYYTADDTSVKYETLSEILPAVTTCEKTISRIHSVENTRKNSKHVGCYFKLCFLSCGIRYDINYA